MLSYLSSSDIHALSQKISTLTSWACGCERPYWQRGKGSAAFPSF